MANPVPSYFLPPQWDFTRNGPIRLGNILSNPKEPQYAINDETRQDLPPLFINELKPNLNITITDRAVSSAGIGSSLLELFGISADVKFERSKGGNWTIKAEEVLTQEINPKDEYVKKCFEMQAVHDHLVKTRYKPLYMITGIKSVSNASVENSDVGKKILFEGKVGVNAAPLTGGTVPLDAHIEGSISRDRNVTGSSGKSNFVLGYKLRKITYLKEKRVKRQEEERKGTVLGDGAVVVEDERETVTTTKFVRLEERSVGSEDFEFFGVRADIEDEKGCEFVLPMYASDEEEN